MPSCSYRIDERRRDGVGALVPRFDGLRVDQTDRDTRHSRVELIDVMRVGAHAESGRQSLADVGRCRRGVLIERFERLAGHTGSVSELFALVHVQ